MFESRKLIVLDNQNANAQVEEEEDETALRVESKMEKGFFLINHKYSRAHWFSFLALFKWVRWTRSSLLPPRNTPNRLPCHAPCSLCNGLVGSNNSYFIVIAFGRASGVALAPSSKHFPQMTWKTKPNHTIPFPPLLPLQLQPTLTQWLTICRGWGIWEGAGVGALF